MRNEIEKNQLKKNKKTQINLSNPNPKTMISQKKLKKNYEAQFRINLTFK